MRLRRVVLAGSLAGLIFATVLIPATSAKQNPPVWGERTIQLNTEMPEPVRQIFARACKNCHSYETEWPWYAKIAPVSWVVAADVERARKALNLSDWAITNGRKPGLAIGALTAACEGVRTERMPPKPYRLLHPESRMDAKDVAVFCQWTAAEVMRQATARRAGFKKSWYFQ